MTTDRPISAPDPYRRRRAAGDASRQDTRRRLVAAADPLFRRHGYHGTTVAAVVERAGVSPQTLYLAWGSKRALFQAAGIAAAGDSQLPLGPEDWQASIRAQLDADTGADPSAAVYLAAVSRLFTQVAERTAVYRRLRRDASLTDPDLAADWATTLSERRRTMTRVAEQVPRRGLRAGVTPSTVVDTVWALASPEVYDLLTTQAGYDPAGFEVWLATTLTAALCS